MGKSNHERRGRSSHEAVKKTSIHTTLSNAEPQGSTSHERRGKSSHEVILVCTQTRDDVRSRGEVKSRWYVQTMLGNSSILKAQSVAPETLSLTTDEHQPRTTRRATGLHIEKPSHPMLTSGKVTSRAAGEIKSRSGEERKKNDTTLSNAESQVTSGGGSQVTK